MEEEIKTYTMTFPGEAVLLLEEALREYGGMLNSEEYPDGPEIESHNIEATRQKERCFKLQMAIRAQCPDVFKVQPDESVESDSEGREFVDEDVE